MPVQDSIEDHVRIIAGISNSRAAKVSGDFSRTLDATVNFQWMDHLLPGPVKIDIDIIDSAKPVSLPANTSKKLHHSCHHIQAVSSTNISAVGINPTKPPDRCRTDSRTIRKCGCNLVDRYDAYVTWS